MLEAQLRRVQEIGYADDVDQEELRQGIQETTGQEHRDEDYNGVANVVLLWFRDEDGDLTDALVDAIGLIDEKRGDLAAPLPSPGGRGTSSPATSTRPRRQRACHEPSP